MSALEYLVYSVVGYTSLVVALYMLSFVVPFAGFVGRALASYGSLILCAIYGALAAIVMRIAGHGRSAQWACARSYKYVMAFTTGVSFEVIDPKNHLNTIRPGVFISNHQTELDVLMLAHIFPRHCSVTSKKELKYVPFLGWFMSLSGSIFIDRKNAKDAREAMKGAADEIKKHRQSVFMFPEGTRSYTKDPIILPFKKGAFHLAVEAQVPIVPVVVCNYSHVLYIKGRVFKAGKIPIKVLEPISTEGLTSADVDQLATNVREMMLKELISITAKAQGSPVAVAAKPHNNGVLTASGAEATSS